MRPRPARKRVALVALIALAGCGGGGGGDGGVPPVPPASVEWIVHWNHVAIDASGLDHTPVRPGDSRVFGEQFGPTRASRAMAIVQIAVFEAVNAITGRYESYTGLPPALADTSLKAAIAQAAHDTLVALYPSQAASFALQLEEDLAGVEDRPAQKEAGIDLGRRAAQSILELRAGDGSDHPEPLVGVDYFPEDAPGVWKVDPVSQIPFALGARWAEVAPFVMTSAAQFRLPPPPALDSAEYAAAYAEVAAAGGDGVTTPTIRTEEQTLAGIYWAYDGTPSLCAPPRLYNQIAVQLAQARGLDLVDTSRLIALVNVAMADAGIASWETKYFYKLERPVTAIRAGDLDGNDATVADTTWTPIGAPASNTTRPNFTPPFPAYPSGHATFGGALFQTLRNIFGTDDVAFTFTSDELNGETVDAEGNVRELRPRSFSSLSEAEEENGQSRIYLGIHWSFDKTGGIAQGRQVADHVFRNLYPPRS
ncbi:MAG: vanadium-dependent haloperoxidase [Deltaproteobacteria bacterium]|nr:vanadium-dependent haloperoxidase [Deltaproteobacteria bacterium]